jgi:RPA family protein
MSKEEFETEISLVIDRLKDLRKEAIKKADRNRHGYWVMKTDYLSEIIVRLKAYKEDKHSRLKDLKETIEWQEEQAIREKNAAWGGDTDEGYHYD